jgi:hypothetical protein
MKGIDQYLERAHELKIIPNFWLTREYLSIQPNIKLETDGKFIWLQEDEWAVFPPLPLNCKDFSEQPPKGLRIWSDFVNYSVGEPIQFLDWEYTYYSANFFDMRGRKWEVFRKNSRKWPRRNEGCWTYTTDVPPVPEIKSLLIKWLDNKKDEEIADSESLIWFVFYGTNRAFLKRKDKLVGMNVWDENGDWLIYRYCIVDTEERFLDEFLRLLFYQSFPGKLVIDGGVLDNPGLEKFKDKLNPIRKRPVYSRTTK